MKKKNTRSKILLSFIAAVLCIGFFVLITYRNMVLTEQESRSISSSIDVLQKLQNVWSDVQDIETGQRGFIITGNEQFLESYRRGIENLRNDTAVLKALRTADSSDRINYSNLIGLIEQKVQASKYAVELRRIYGIDSAAKYVERMEGFALMNNIRNHVSMLENQDRITLQYSSLKRDSLSQKRAWQLFSLAIIFFVILYINYRVINRDFIFQQKSERLLRYNASLISIISDAIVTTDKEYKITNWNKYAQKLYGYDENEALGRGLLELLHIESESLSMEEVIKLFNETGQWKGELIHYQKNGTPLNVDVAVSAIVDPSGEIIGTVSVIRDITERYRTEKRLKQLTYNLEEEVKEKVAELNGIFERITDAFIALDNDWNYTYANTRAAAMDNFLPEDLIGKNIWEIFPHFITEPFYEALHRAKETRESLRLELYFSKNDQWFEDLIYPSENGMSVYYRDITNRKKAEQQLLDSEKELSISNERFLLVAKATNDAVWDWDMQTDVIWGNESFRKIFGIGAEEPISFEQFASRLHPEDRDMIMHNLNNALATGTTYLAEEFRFLSEQGDYLTLYDRAYILYDEAGKAFRMLGAMQDITLQKLAQHQLLIEKDLSDNIINSLPGIFYLFNQKGNFLRWNRNMEQVTGYSGRELQLLHPVTLFDESEQGLISDKIKNVFLTGEDQVEAFLKTKDYKMLPYYFTGMVINYEGEDCLMGVGIDISERIKSQQELKESEERYRTLIEQASDGIFISNQDGDYVDVNTSASILTGYSKAELLKLNIRDIILEHDLTERPLMLGEIKKGMVLINERTMRQKNGQLIVVEISAKMLPDGRFQGIVRDITARKKTEAEIRMSEHKYRLLFNSNPMPMWMISMPERNFLDVNDAAIAFYGYSKEEFMGMNIRDLRPDNEYSKFSEIISSFKSGITNAGTWKHKKKNGDVIKVNIITHEILYEGKQAKLFLANDITEKIEAEEKLQRSHEELRQLATHLQDIREDERTRIAREIHDELGQQLTGLKMDISWLSKKINGQAPEINQKLAESLVLIDDTVKTVRRIATQLRPSILDDLGLISAMEWQSEEFEKRFKIETVFKANITVLDIDAEVSTGLFRVFQESLTNILRHAKASRVNASLHLEHESLTLQITDNGVGFEVDNIGEKKTLGLLGMKERTLMMGGTYHITSDPGMGTTVLITVPIHH
jgi:PAS domain S-box-containing protein